ncbi:hypothetical protein PsorP6_016992 [Peronosclerospora sorghi]|uniref:Uncharacterized protein n=1 Tax=Peronosclerospora sorghi TaxID=230839 RepID=A0ACC0WCL5_9STRA|nr:hypothetical protein PsorP6_016992 [Peronosclerospora sorghi]
MTNDACQHSHTQFSAPPLSRQRSLEAIASFASGKIRTLEIPAGIITHTIRNSLLPLLLSPNKKFVGVVGLVYMTNEEDLYDFCFSNELLTLGWIHAVAIVVAPNDPQKTPAAKINVNNGQSPKKIAESF